MCAGSIFGDLIFKEKLVSAKGGLQGAGDFGLICFRSSHCVL
jgi:hypothetical protein